VKNHAGNCSIYDVDVRLCDCGLGRATMAMGNDEGEKHFCRLKEIAGLDRNRRAMAERIARMERVVLAAKDFLAMVRGECPRLCEDDINAEALDQALSALKGGGDE